MYLKEFTADQRVTDYNEELMAKYQSNFLMAFDRPAEHGKDNKPKRKPRMRKCPLAVIGQRRAAKFHIRALDKMMLLVFGIGVLCLLGQLRQLGEEGSNAVLGCREAALQSLTEGRLRPTLVLFGDEGSLGYSMNWYLVYYVGLRLLPVRNTFHRQCNDCKLAVSDFGLWCVIQLATIPFNLNFGPWESTAWFSNIVQMAERLLETIDAANPQHTALYALICKDMGHYEPKGSPEHKRIIFEMCFQGDAFKTKGVKVSLNRWFAWLAAASLFVRDWHVRMLSYICIGQCMGVFKSWREVPFWAGLIGKPAAETERGTSSSCRM